MQTGAGKTGLKYAVTDPIETEATAQAVREALAKIS